MKKKYFLVLILGFVLILSAFAGGKNETTDSSSANENVTLRFSWWGSNTRHQAILNAIEIYESRHPNVTIEGEYGAFADFYQKLLTQFAGGTAPDIITVDNKWVADLMNQGAPIVNMYTLSDEIDMSGFDMDFVKSWGGNDEYLIGLPAASNGMGYLYNVEFLEEFGIEPNDNWTWDTVIENGKKVQAQDPSKYLMYNIADHWVYLIKSMLKQINGKTLITDDYEIAFSREDIIQVFSYIRELVDTRTVPPFSEGVLYETVHADQNPNWLNGNIGIFPTTSSLITGIADVSPFEVKTMRYPIMENPVNPGIQVNPSFFFGIYSKSEHQDIAADFIDFLLNDPEAIDTIKDTIGVPPNKYAADRLVAENVIPENVINMVNQAISGAGIADNGPSLNPEVLALTKDYVQQIGYGVLSPEEAADGYMEELAALLDSIK